MRRATTDDIRQVSRTAMRAFVDDPVMRWLVPDDDEYEADDGVFVGAFHQWVAHDETWMTPDGVAVAAWVPPGRPEVDVQMPAGRPEPPPERREKFAALQRVMDPNTPPEPHWYLNLLATHPDWQRNGLGAALMQIMFERADDEGLPCYLETETPDNVAYYRHHGFEVRSEWDVPLDGPHMWGMLRAVR